MTGMSPSYNVLTNGSQIPKFSTTKATNVVCHREYLGDISGTAGFNVTSYPLNPGMTQTFPWLSGIAGNYQQYKIHGLIFEFRPLITDNVTGGSPGVIVFATNYNADASSYTTKQQMESSEFAVSIKPTHAMIHGVECADNETPTPMKYIRTGAVPTGQDLRLYDMGVMQLATQLNPVVNLGELWVSYCVEFYKPTLGVDMSGPVIQSASLPRMTPTNANPLGTIQLAVEGTLVSAAGSPNTLSWFADPGTAYLVDICWSNGAPVAWTAPGASAVGLQFMQTYQNNTASVFLTPPNGTTTTSASLQWVVKSTLLNGGLVSITLNGLGTVPVGYVDIYITQITSTAI